MSGNSNRSAVTTGGFLPRHVDPSSRRSPDATRRSTGAGSAPTARMAGERAAVMRHRETPPMANLDERQPRKVVFWLAGPCSCASCWYSAWLSCRRSGS